MPWIDARRDRDVDHPAQRTGAMVTPLARRRPWVLARQIATLDQLSGGRLTVGVGLGDDGWREFSAFGEETSPRARGELLDESLEILLRLLSGNAVTYRGVRFVIDSEPLLPTPVQDPVPILGRGPLAEQATAGRVRPGCRAASRSSRAPASARHRPRLPI